LQQGKKVFEGSVAEVKTAQGKIALKTPDFTRATLLLRERGLITATAEERFITLAEGRSIAEIVQTLVSAGTAVEGIWQHEQTVEDFYLELVSRQNEGTK
jgi:ABC-type multidrug transport system ATPase subunit